MNLLSLFRRKRFDDDQKTKLVDAVCAILEIQVAFGSRTEVPNLATPAGAKALGYVYGFVDAALRTVGQDMSDMSVGIPITFQVLRRVFPGHEERYLEYLTENLGTNDVLMRGMMLGGQQYLDFGRGKLAAPMGLARSLLELSDSPQSDVGS